MYRVIVVDDEQIIRNGISGMIDNEIDDFCCIASLSDGIEVIEYLQENDADVIVSDIRMVNVSGIELAKYIYENKSHIKVVLLSGYSDFEYAKAAVRYKVTDYILKPTDFDELKAVFDRIKTELSDDNEMVERRLFNERVQFLYSCIRENDDERAHAAIENYFEEIPRNTARYISDLYEMIYERLQNHSKIELKPFDTGRLSDHYSRDTVKESAHNLYDEISEIFNGNSDEYSSEVKKYIDNHFCEDISLQSVAEAVALSPVYLSRYFKKNIGENFSDYILKLRMEKAAEMFMNNKRVNEVSISCGFNNSGYFAKVFKNYYGYTPKDYIRFHGNNVRGEEFEKK